MYAVSAQQLLDRTGKFCSRHCAGKWNHARNNPRPPRMVKIGSVVRTLPEWAKKFGICVSLVYRRMRSGMTPEAALTMPKSRANGERVCKS